MGGKDKGECGGDNNAQQACAKKIIKKNLSASV